jgi:hypothetical protein
MTAFGIAAPDAHPFQQRLLGALPTGWSLLLEQGVQIAMTNFTARSLGLV